MDGYTLDTVNPRVAVFDSSLLIASGNRVITALSCGQWANEDMYINLQTYFECVMALGSGTQTYPEKKMTAQEAFAYVVRIPTLV